MVASNGRFPFFIPKKPTQFGFKLWVLAKPHTGYTWNFEVYTERLVKLTVRGEGACERPKEVLEPNSALTVSEHRI